ncbi:alpha/beta hydrolase family protein [Hoeflea marina]|uniref:Alpha/beta hydrolase family protein n=1 Tax=Hoeflea marina TaxID=274592 RepID=A0A317PID9_9HYPH|nr:alpha/beta fold hydrolase [Hoeflea marina]PWV99188.1 alpha/beta hydrolase family protein [Hoeflea marina]
MGYIDLSGPGTATSRLRSAAVPVRFGGCAGLFNAAEATAPASDSAVLLVSPWGFEEMCLRKFHCEIGEALAAKGIACLRFDLPGTGDSADPAGDASLAGWRASVTAAAAELKRLSGARSVILAGHGLGATLALDAADGIDDVAGLALLAPVTSGRSYLRETALWWKMVAADLYLDPAADDGGGLSIAGLVLPAGITAELRNLKAAELRLARPLPVLLVGRSAAAGDEELATQLQAAGCPVERLVYEGYEALKTNPMRSRSPAAVIEGLAGWARMIAPNRAPGRTVATCREAGLAGDGFRETGIRFGDHGRLSGTLCEPAGPRRGASVLIVGTGYDRASGWGRMGVKTARGLAGRGIASLRFDAAGVGDSPPCPGDPDQVLYAPCIDRDVAAAVAELVRRVPGPTVLSGRCSGGYHAFRAALREPSCRGVVSVNSYAYVWDPDVDFNEALAGVARPLRDYSQRALNPKTFKRLMAGEVDVRRAGLNIARQIGRGIAGRFGPRIAALVHRNRLRADIENDFRRLQADGRLAALVYGDDDPGLEQFRMVFGHGGERLKHYPNVVRVSLGDSDHNVTSAEAQDRVIATIGDMALRVG